MDQIYHGCAYVNADGTNKIITEANDCLFQTSKCFWKDPSDVFTHIKTCSMMKKALCFSKGIQQIF